jgi:RHS repeat-associated protein
MAREATGTAGNLLSLPSGGGGVSALGDRFRPDLVRGTGNYSVPINLPRGPNELKPSLSLTYSTGAGNGPFGHGWQLNLSSIQRRTDRGVPTYSDEDSFVIGGAEVLVHVGGNRYRPKTDTQFWLIERLAESWRVRTGDGRMLLFGQAEASREGEGDAVLAWYLDEERDAAGNAVRYTYRRDGNRLYLDEIRYGIFRLKAIYEPRPDLLRNGRAGFARLTALRTQALELHCDRLAPSLMRSYRLSYRQAANGMSLLEKLELVGVRDGEEARFPDLRFTYSELDFDRWSISELRALVPPPRLDTPGTQLVDLTGDGLPDVLSSTNGRMLLWTNRGDGWLDGPRALEGVPSTVGLERANVAFADLDGNGRVELFAVDQPLQLAFETTGKGGFRPEPVVFRERPDLRLAAGDTRLMDLDGDGVTDLLCTHRTHFLLYRHEPGQGFQDPAPVRRIADLDQFPDVTFGERGMHIADMSGGGFQDMVTVRGGEVAYWPYQGNGRWGRRVAMAGPPELPPGYRDERLRLVDLDGDGCADLIYFDLGRTLIWLNRSGTGFAPPFEIPVAPPPMAEIFTVDLYGDGRPGFAWQASVGVEDGTGYRVLRFDPETAPYLMTEIDNGVGGRFAMAYATTTAMRRADQEAGRDWLGELPFVVHVVQAIEDEEVTTGRRTMLSMRYHDGVFDGPDRQFRGFSSVTVEMSGDDSVPASRQEVEFFQGDPEHPDLAERERQRALAGTLLRTCLYERTGAGDRLATESTEEWEIRIEHDVAGERVIFPHVTRIETRELSPTGAPTRIERTRLADFDAHGNPGRRLRESFADGEPEANWIRSEERFTYVTDEAEWLVRLPVRGELRDGDGVPFSVQVRYYDGAPFQGLPEGQASRGLPTRTQEVRLLDVRLPGDYVGGRDLAALGYARLEGGDVAGWYATTMAARRDGFGNIVEQRDPAGVPLRIDYDADGVFPIRSIDARGKETLYHFDPRSGEPVRITFPDGREVRHEHDPIGRLVAKFETDDAGDEQLTDCWLIDLASLPTSITAIAPAAGGRNRAEFLAAPDLAQLDGVSVARVFYDGFGKQLLKVATGPDEPGGARRFIASEQVQINPRGLVAVQFAPRFVAGLGYLAPPAVDAAAVIQRYDLQGNIVETVGPGPVHFRVVRDSFEVAHFEGAAAGSVGAPVPVGSPYRIERFDARGRLVRIEEADGAGGSVATQYDLSPDGRIATVRAPDGGELIAYTIAGPSEPIRIRHRDVGARSYYRDAAGRIAERLDLDGGRLLHAYDVQGRLIRMDHELAGGGALQTVRELVYDEDPVQPSAGRFLEGRIAVLREAGNECRYSYNRSGRTVAEEVTTAGTTLRTERRFDLQGRASAIRYPDGETVTYRLDRSGSVAEIVGFADAFAYAADSTLESYTLANGVTVEMPRDSVSRRLTSVAARHGGNVLRRLDYAYDGLGTLRTLRDEMPGGIEHHRFGYDGLSRLTSFEVRGADPEGPLLRSGSYAYDAEGNLAQFGDVQPLALAYDDAARPARLTALTLGTNVRQVRYDQRSNISRVGQLNEMEYDAHDRLIRVRMANGVEVRFAYDAQSRRIMKQVTRNGTTTTVHYATGLFEQHGDHAIRHVFLGKQLVASERVEAGADSRAYYLGDHHGTVLLATDAVGAILHNQRYSPFGASLDATTALDRYLGRERDRETGLVQFGARYYAPAFGRFVSPDWYVLENPKLAARIPQAFNIYSYAINNPLTFKDPSGLFIFIVAGIIAAIVTIAAIATIAAFAVGFVAGLVYGLANGQGWDSLLTALETALTTTVGMWLGGITGFLVGGPVGLVIGAIMGGMNGLISGMTGIYNWASIDGWFAFLSDSTWGLLGTSLGNIVHIINLFYSDSNYRTDLSRRQNRHVYEGGFALKSDFAFTQGNVISNASQGGGPINASFIANHEELHIWQSRIFGPLFQLTYVAWAVGGFIVGSIVWLFNTDEDWGSLVETAAYYDNPFEYWAYKNDSNWPPSGANPLLTWG